MLRGICVIAVLAVDAELLRLTLVVVKRVVAEAEATCVDDNKSDLIKPSVPLCLTRDQPFD